MAETQSLAKIDAKGPPGTLANLKAFVTQPAMMQSLKDVCTSILKPEQVAKQLFLAASRQPKLLECTLPSLCKGIATAGQLGLDCSGTLGSGYLVPYFNGKTRQMEAQFIPGYRGLVDLARRSGSILDIQAHVVYACDQWEYRLGTNPVLNHTPNFDGERSDKQIIGAYAVAWLRDAQPHPEFMSIGEINGIRGRSKAKDGGPWVTDFAEMCKKTVVRRIVKLLPLSIEAASAIAMADEDEPAVDEIRPRREVASLNIEEVLGKATETTTQPGGTAETAPQPRKSVEPPQETVDAPEAVDEPPSEPQDAPEPIDEAPQESEPQEMTEADKLVIELAEVAKCAEAAARTKLEEFCPKFYRSDLYALSAKQVSDLRATIKRNEIKVNPPAPLAPPSEPTRPSRKRS